MQLPTVTSYPTNFTVINKLMSTAEKIIQPVYQSDPNYGIYKIHYKKQLRIVVVAHSIKCLNKLC